MTSRDDFTESTKETLAKRVGYRCSNPNCRKLTIGPKEGDNSAMSYGIAAHITAAAPGGPRYCVDMTQEERKSFDNGIWLCSNCSIIIDRDVNYYTVKLLKSWKMEAERKASVELTSSTAINATTAKVFVKQWTDLPDFSDSNPIAGINIMLFEFGGKVCKGDRWINYINSMDEWKRPYLEAIREDVIRRNIRFGGMHYQLQAKITPMFNNNKLAIFSMRAWGDLMAAIWSEHDNIDYSYTDFYI